MIDPMDYSNMADDTDSVPEMHRLHRQAFHDCLGWDVAVSGDMERDDYDAIDPTYLIHRADEGAAGGCARLLPTTGPYMLRKTFPVLAHAGMRPHWPAQFHHPDQRFHGPFSNHSN